MDGVHTDHPFCYACLGQSDAMLSAAVGSTLHYVPLDTVNYGLGGSRGIPDRHPLTIEEAKKRFRPPSSSSSSAAATSTITVTLPDGRVIEIEKPTPPGGAQPKAAVTSNDTEGGVLLLEKYTNSPGARIDWMNGAVATEDKEEVRRVALDRLASLRRDAVKAFEEHGAGQVWSQGGARTCIK